MTKYVNKMKIAIVLFLIAFGFNNLKADPYDFNVKVEPYLVGNVCCVKITVEIPEKLGHTETHSFDLYIGEEIVADGENYTDQAVLTGWKYGGEDYTTTICLEVDEPTEFDLFIQIWCDGEELDGPGVAHFVDGLDGIDDDIFEEVNINLNQDCTTCNCWNIFLDTNPAGRVVPFIAEPYPEYTECPAPACPYRINVDFLADFIDRLDECYDYIYFEVEGQFENGDQYRKPEELTSFMEQYVTNGQYNNYVLCSTLRDGTVTIGFSETEYGESGNNCIWTIDMPCIEDPDIDQPDNDLIEEPEPCTPDCITDNWEFDGFGRPFKGFITLTINNETVNITYEYTYRYACGQYQDIQVLSFVCTSTGVITDYAEIYALMIQDIIENQGAITGFTPSTDNMVDDEERCDSTWRVMAGSCWADIEVAISQSLEYPDGLAVDLSTSEYEELPTSTLPDILSSHLSNFGQSAVGSGCIQTKCETDCCLQQIKVCVTQTANGLVWNKSVLDLPDNQINCDELYYHYNDYDLPCEPRCSWLVTMNNYWGNNKIIINEEKDKQAIQTYLSQNQFEIISNDSEEGTMYVKIYDNIGNLLISQNKMLGNGKQRLLVNTTELRTGSYYYTITINGKIMKSKKFIIVK